MVEATNFKVQVYTFSAVVHDVDKPQNKIEFRRYHWIVAFILDLFRIDRSIQLKMNGKLESIGTNKLRDLFPALKNKTLEELKKLNLEYIWNIAYPEAVEQPNTQTAVDESTSDKQVEKHDNKPDTDEIQVEDLPSSPTDEEKKIESQPNSLRSSADSIKSDKSEEWSNNEHIVEHQQPEQPLPEQKKSFSSIRPKSPKPLKLAYYSKFGLNGTIQQELKSIVSNTQIINNFDQSKHLPANAASCKDIAYNYTKLSSYIKVALEDLELDAQNLPEDSCKWTANERGQIHSTLHEYFTYVNSQVIKDADQATENEKTAYHIAKINANALIQEYELALKEANNAEKPSNTEQVQKNQTQGWLKWGAQILSDVKDVVVEKGTELLDTGKAVITTALHATVKNSNEYKDMAWKINRLETFFTDTLNGIDTKIDFNYYLNSKDPTLTSYKNFLQVLKNIADYQTLVCKTGKKTESYLKALRNNYSDFVNTLRIACNDHVLNVDSDPTIRKTLLKIANNLYTQDRSDMLEAIVSDIQNASEGFKVDTNKGFADNLQDYFDYFNSNTSQATLIPWLHKAWHSLVDGANIDFDPLLGSNIPSSFEEGYLAFGTPTIQYTTSTEINVCPIFESYLAYNEEKKITHLYVNYQDATSKESEQPRSNVIMGLQDKYEHFYGMTFSKNTKFYKMKEQPDLETYGAFKEKLTNEFFRKSMKDSGIFIPDAIHLQFAGATGIQLELYARELMDKIQQNLFSKTDSIDPKSNKSVRILDSNDQLTIEDRKLFNEQFEQQLVESIEKALKIKKKNKTCKDGIDRGILAWMIEHIKQQLISGVKVTDESINKMFSLIMARALMVRKRGIDGHRFDRLIDHVRFMEKTIVDLRKLEDEVSFDLQVKMDAKKPQPIKV